MSDIHDELTPAQQWHSATVIDEQRPALKQTTSGPPKVVAAWLRAVADQLDPPRPHMRGLSQDRSSSPGNRDTKSG